MFDLPDVPEEAYLRAVRQLEVRALRPGVHDKDEAAINVVSDWCRFRASDPGFGAAQGRYVGLVEALKPGVYGDPAELLEPLASGFWRVIARSRPPWEAEGEPLPSLPDEVVRVMLFSMRHDEVAAWCSGDRRHVIRRFLARLVLLVENEDLAQGCSDLLNYLSEDEAHGYQGLCKNMHPVDALFVLSGRGSLPWNRVYAKYKDYGHRERHVINIVRKNGVDLSNDDQLAYLVEQCQLSRQEVIKTVLRAVYEGHLHIVDRSCTIR